jgi:tol-pal system protein YbgF
VDARLASPAGPETAAGAPARPPAAASGPPTEPPAAPPTAAPPSARVLYDNALRDFTSGKYDLARQQFLDYLRYYGRTPLAGNAQFYIGETYYRQNDFRRAITEYDKVLESFPDSNKVAGAYLKKGYALLELGQREDGVAALRTLVQRFPRSDEARWARARLERLGEPVSR